MYQVCSSSKLSDEQNVSLEVWNVIFFSKYQIYALGPVILVWARKILALFSVEVYLVNKWDSWCNSLRSSRVQKKVEAKVWYPRLEISVKHNVICFEIAVNDWFLRCCVKVVQSFDNADRQLANYFPSLWIIDSLCRSEEQIKMRTCKQKGKTGGKYYWYFTTDWD